MSNQLKKIFNKLGISFIKFAEHAKMIIWVRSSDWSRYLFVSPSFETFWGKSRESLYENAALWLQGVEQKDRDRLQQQMLKIKLKSPKGCFFSEKYRLRSRTLPVHCISDFGMPLYEFGRCIGFVGVAQEISHEQFTDKSFDEERFFFNSFLSKIERAFWVRDLLGSSQLYLSPAYEKIWRRSRKELYDDPSVWLSTLLPEDREANQMGIRLSSFNSVDHAGRFVNRYRIQRPDGEVRWIKDVNYPICDDKNCFIAFAGLAEDITDDVLRENELSLAKENAEKANQAKSNFLAMMSHELRTPLNSILGMAQILDMSSLTEEQKNYISIITQAGENFLGLLNDLLDFSKLEAGVLRFINETIPLFELVDRVAQDMSINASSKNLLLRLEYNLAKDLFVICDPKRVSQILINLLSNAIKFTEQGYILLEVSLVQKNQDEIFVCFTVKDTGIGIDKSKINSIFERFQQIDSVFQRKYDGVGLGLAIVKELAERMGGCIMVTSELGIGSQFSCILPFRMAEHVSLLPQGMTVAKASKLSIPKYNLSVLIVEDNPINQKISKLLLEKFGCHVDIADCAEGALQKISNHYDIIFMDIGLPDQDGFTIVEKIRKLEKPGHHVPIIAMTAHVLEEDKERCLQVGMNEVIHKPIIQSKLLSILNRWAVKQN